MIRWRLTTPPCTLDPPRSRDIDVNDERPDTPREDGDEAPAGDVDAQALLNASRRAIASLRRQAVVLFEGGHTFDVEQGEQRGDKPPAGRKSDA
jgi:hypothetical protein